MRAGDGLRAFINEALNQLADAYLQAKQQELGQSIPPDRYREERRKADYAREVTKTLQDNGFRADFDLRNEKIGFKIREHTLQRVPYLLVVGDREVQTGTLAVRNRAGRDLGTLGIADFIARLSGEVVKRSH